MQYVWTVQWSWEPPQSVMAFAHWLLYWKFDGRCFRHWTLFAEYYCSFRLLVCIYALNGDKNAANVFALIKYQNILKTISYWWIDGRPGNQQQVAFFFFASAADCSWNSFFFLAISSITGFRSFFFSSRGWIFDNFYEIVWNASTTLSPVLALTSIKPRFRDLQKFYASSKLTCFFS